MLALVIHYGHLLGLIQQNIGGLENGIVQESSAHSRLMRSFLFIRFCRKFSFKGLSKITLAIPCYTPGILMLEVSPWN